jgi:hypothetical protein
LLLVVIIAAVVAAVVLLTKGSSKSENGNTIAVTTPSPKSKSSGKSTTGVSGTTGKTSATTTTSTSNGPKEEAHFTLSSRVTGVNATASVEVLAEDGKHAFYITATGLPPSKGFFYAVWLYNSPTESKGVGRAPTVGSNGRLEGGLLLPSDASQYHEMLLTEETTTTPAHPGPVVLSGPFNVG